VERCPSNEGLYKNMFTCIDFDWRNGTTQIPPVKFTEGLPDLDWDCDFKRTAVVMHIPVSHRVIGDYIIWKKLPPRHFCLWLSKDALEKVYGV
jgi:hypothetical protein